MKQKDALQFRLAIRYEGSDVNAYMAKKTDMDGAVLIATASRKILEDDPAMREKFITFAGEMLQSFCGKTLGVAPEFGKRSTPPTGWDQMTKPGATAADIKVSRALPAVAHELETLLSEAAGEQVMFSLFSWGAGNTEFANYITNCRRQDIIKALREWLVLAEAGSSDVPLHRRN